MRKILALILFATLALVACAETGVPAPPATERAVAPAATSIASPAIQAPADVLPIAPSEVPATPGPVEPTIDTAPTLAAPSPLNTPLPEQPTEDTIWPHFLRELALGIPAGNSHAPRALAIHPSLGQIYVRTQVRRPGASSTDSITLLDLQSGQVQKVVELASYNYGEGTLAVDTSLDRLYATNPDTASISVFDAQTLDPITVLEGTDLVALDSNSGQLYIAGLDGLTILDSATYAGVLHSSLPPAREILALALDPVASRLYLVYRAAETYVLSVHDAATLESVATVPLPGQPDDLVADPARGRLYATLDDGENTLLWILNDNGSLLQDERLGAWTYNTHLALDPKGNRLFLGREAYGNYGITVVDLEKDEKIADIALDEAPDALIWDEQGKRLLVSQASADRVSVVDLQAGLVSDRFPTAIDLVDLALDPERGHVYIIDSNEWLHILDAVSDRELSVLPAEGRLSVDSSHGRFYTGGQGADRVRIFDAEKLQQTSEIRSQAIPVADPHSGGLYLVDNGIFPASLETLTTTGVISDTLPQNPGFSPNPTAIDALVDPGSGRIFAKISNGVPGSNGGTYLYAYEPETYHKILTDTERSPIYLDIDPSTGQVYVSRTHLAGRSTSLLADGREYTARLDSVFGALRVDPALNRLYLTVAQDGQIQMLILDAGNLDALTMVPVPGTLLALDPIRHLAYLSTGQGRIEIWSVLGGQPPPSEPPAPAALAPEDIYELFEPPDGDLVFAVDRDYHLYRSDDNGASWLHIKGGLPNEWVLDLAFSPEFSRDQTIFAALATADQGFGVWESTDGGESWHWASQGLTDLAVTNLILSPEFSADRTLFAAARRGGIMRSTDSAGSWVPLTERYQPQRVSSQPPGNLAFSPGYAQDQTLYLNHYGLQRSTDGGDTWARIRPTTLSPLVLSPAFSTDHTLFGWTGMGGLLRSTDSGDTWTAAGVGLTLSDWGSARILVPPQYPADHILYFVWVPSSPDAAVQLYRSVDSAATWARLDGELPPITLLELSSDGTTFVAQTANGESIRWPVDELKWQAGALPPLDDITVDSLYFSPGTTEVRTLYALSRGSGVLRSVDGGIRWTETGFPVRIDWGEAEELVFLGPDSLFVGTALGLYHFSDRAGWVPVAGGLPQGLATSSPIIGQDGSMRVFVEDGGEGNLRVFLSTDRGRAWGQALPELPYDANPDDVYFSPAFAVDRTAFVAALWSPPFRSAGGGAWERFGPPGTSLAMQFQIAPISPRDALLFMELVDASLWRSADAGATWTQLNVPWVGSSVSELILSPTFAQDNVLWAAVEDELYRSADQGTSWSLVLQLSRYYPQILFAPGYEKSREIYLVQTGILYHSVDGGQTWQALDQVPWGDNDPLQLLSSPAFVQDRTLLAWQSSGGVYRSLNGGQTWLDASRGIPSEGIQDVLFSPNYPADGLAYLIPKSGGIYKQLRSDDWRPITESAPRPTPTARALATPTTPPRATATLPACAQEPTHFQAVWQVPEVRTGLGCPSQPAEQVLLGEQPFERGLMFWDSSNRQIYVLSEKGSWQSFDDTWNSDQAATDPTLVAPEGRVQPQRGFGKVWREELGGSQAAIGWATEGERAVNGWRQPFEMGLLLWSDDVLEGEESVGTAYLLYADGRWQAIAAPAP